jgi:hypothetical protein
LKNPTTYVVQINQNENGDCYIDLPIALLEAANIQVGDEVEVIDMDDGRIKLVKSKE